MERRVVQRFELKLPANLVAGSGSDKPIVAETVTRDISSGGAFCFGAADLAVGVPVNCQIFLHREKEVNYAKRNGVIFVDGVVVRAEADGVAVKFDSKHTILSKAS